VSTYFIHINDA